MNEATCCYDRPCCVKVQAELVYYKEYTFPVSRFYTNASVRVSLQNDAHEYIHSASHAPISVVA